MKRAFMASGLLLLIAASTAWASGGSGAGHTDPVAPAVLALAAPRQPAVLGGLLAGALLGNVDM